jgi:hypothetical protein
MKHLELEPDDSLDVIPRTREKMTVHLGGWISEVALTIPEGTPCIPATNLTKGGYWLDPAPECIPEDFPTESWLRNVGIHLEASEVEEP